MTAQPRRAPDGTPKRRAKAGEARCDSCKHYHCGCGAHGGALRPICDLAPFGGCRADDATCSKREGRNHG